MSGAERASGEAATIALKRYEDGLALKSLSGLPSSRRQVQAPEPDILRKEVIQPQVPLRLPCYDFTPVAEPTVVGCLLLRGWRTTFG
jgi:hypothetical protein